MTTLELNEELFRQLAVISTDEGMMRKAIKALKRITGTKEDKTLMSREDFMARIEHAAQGKAKSFGSVEDIDKYVRSL
jgi:C4-type Zn-finger protein